MSDEEENLDRRNDFNHVDDEVNMTPQQRRNSSEDVTGKKTKKKKKSSSSSSSKKAERSSPTTGGDSSPTVVIAVVGSSILSKLTEPLKKIRDSILSAANLSNQSPRATLTRVLFLVILCIIVMGIGNNLSMSTEIKPIQAIAEPEPEEVIVQKLPGKANKKITTAMEKDFGCRELQCVAQCNGKAKPKCLKSRSCVSERDKICQKRCRKTRCEDRCKDEPHLGYVEREQGLEKCKDACTGPTASHNKCVVKCHVKYKPCKSRCFETANKFKCDNPKILAMAQAQSPGSSSSSSSSSSKDDEDDEGDGGGGSGDAEDDEGGGDAPPPPKKKSPSIPGLDDDDLL
jgi:hypothetical protein